MPREKVDKGDSILYILSSEGVCVFDANDIYVHLNQTSKAKASQYNGAESEVTIDHYPN